MIGLSNFWQKVIFREKGGDRREVEELSTGEPQRALRPLSPVGRGINGEVIRQTRGFFTTVGYVE